MLWNPDEKLSRTPEIQEWIERNQWEEHEPLKVGQRVRAAQDIFWSETSNRVIEFGTLGRVVERSEDNPDVYGVKWDKKKTTWYCVYEPTTGFMDDPENPWAWDSEILPVDEPDPAQDPHRYMEQLI